MTKTTVMIGVLWAASTLAASAAELPKALVEPYLQAQVLLANDQIKGVDVAAKAVESAAIKVGKGAEAITAGARKLGAAKSIDNARDAFGDLSEALLAYSNKTRASMPKDVHLVYCTMKEKHWMQKGQDTKNPYFGSEMIDCGVFKK